MRTTRGYEHNPITLFLLNHGGWMTYNIVVIMWLVWMYVLVKYISTTRYGLLGRWLLAMAIVRWTVALIDLAGI